MLLPVGQDKKSKFTLYLEISLDKDNTPIPEIRALLLEKTAPSLGFYVAGDMKNESQVRTAGQNSAFGG